MHVAKEALPEGEHIFSLMIYHLGGALSVTSLLIHDRFLLVCA